MVVAGSHNRVTELAQDLFTVVTQLCLTTPRGRRGDGDLKEVEYLTLAILHNQGTRTVGDIQRLLNVLPAQMSRIIRSLEDRPAALISCGINPQDKRKVNVALTEAGEEALTSYRATRVHRIAELLRDLPEEDQESMVRLLEKVRGLLEPSAGS